MLAHTARNVIQRRAVRRKGTGIVNTLINKLPFEAHIPGYRFCGPGTRLQKRLSRGDSGVNPLDEACKRHDIAYSQSNSLSDRHAADKVLAEKAWGRFRSKDASFGEKTAALAIAGIMKAKTKLGMGARKRRSRKRLRKGGVISFPAALKRVRNNISNGKGSDIQKLTQLALASIKKKKISKPKQRILKLPKTGGILPLIPIFAALSALGSLGGGAAAVAKAVNDAKSAAKDLEEKKRHNKVMEAVNIGKGLSIAPYRNGLGLYLRPYDFNQKNYQ